jgi:hypothetical protein
MAMQRCRMLSRRFLHRALLVRCELVRASSTGCTEIPLRIAAPAAAAQRASMSLSSVSFSGIAAGQAPAPAMENLSDLLGSLQSVLPVC